MRVWKRDKAFLTRTKPRKNKDGIVTNYGNWRGVLPFIEDGRRSTVTTVFKGTVSGKDSHGNVSPVVVEFDPNDERKGERNAKKALNYWADKTIENYETALLVAEQAAQEEAEQIAQELQAQEDEASGKNITVAEAIERYIAEGQNTIVEDKHGNRHSKIAVTTASTYRYIAPHITEVKLPRAKTTIGDMRVRDVTERTILAWDNMLRNDAKYKVGASVRQKAIALFSATLKSCARVKSDRDKVIVANPFDNIDSTDLARQRPIVRDVAASSEEMQRIRDLIDLRDPEGIDAFSVAVKVALGTGARVGEICGLKFSDVTNDEADGYVLTIRRAIGRVGGKLIEKDTKSHKIRRVPLTDDLVSVIESRRIWMQRQTNRFDVGDYYITGYPDAKPLSPNNCSKMWATFAKTFTIKGKDREGNVQALGFHGLRHSFASDYIRRNGYSDGAYDRLSRVLGHSSITITRETYVNPSMQNTRRDMESGVPDTGASALKEADVIAFAPTGTND